MSILGIHVNFTSPNQGKNLDSKEYEQHDYDILTTIISSLKWRQFNGNIKLYTDSYGYDFYKNNNLIDLWDAGIDCSLENIVYEKINPDIFWAAGKIYAIKKQKNPFVIMDTDFIFWKRAEDFLKGNDVVCPHIEPLFYYKDIDYFCMKEEYLFNKNWDWKINPSNNAFVYFENMDFKNKYVENSILFMEKSKPNMDDNSSYGQYILFAEQRLLVMCAKESGINIKFLFDGEFPPDDQDIVTHVWCSKRDVLQKNSELKKEFCKKCIRRIINDYPHFKERLLNIPQLSPYFDYIRSEFK